MMARKKQDIFLLEQMIDQTRRHGGSFIPYKATTTYLNTIRTAK